MYKGSYQWLCDHVLWLWKCLSTLVSTSAHSAFVKRTLRWHTCLSIWSFYECSHRLDDNGLQLLSTPLLRELLVTVLKLSVTVEEKVHTRREGIHIQPSCLPQVVFLTQRKCEDLSTRKKNCGWDSRHRHAASIPQYLIAFPHAEVELFEGSGQAAGKRQRGTDTEGWCYIVRKLLRSEGWEASMKRAGTDVQCSHHLYLKESLFYQERFEAPKEGQSRGKWILDCQTSTHWDQASVLNTANAVLRKPRKSD